MVVAAVFVAVSAANVVRSAAVADDRAPEWAALAWPDHPALLKAEIMTRVGFSAARGQEPPPQTLQQLRDLAYLSPLAVEPMLVHGAIALRRGDGERGLRLFRAAADRAPRSAAARYLLADAYLRANRPAAAMQQMAVLNRLFAGASAQLAPALAEFARRPGGSAEVRRVLKSYPELEAPLLTELAADPDNMQLILALAGTGGREPGAAAQVWQQRLISSLVERGDYAQAHSVWRQVSGVPAQPGQLFNPAFSEVAAPPPFNWDILQGSAGVAGARNGGLDVIYYGRDDAVLARQIVLLRPGVYSLSQLVSGDPGSDGNVRWVVQCLPSKRQLASAPLPGGGGTRRLSVRFAVPATDCPAQSIELVGEKQELPNQVQFRIASLQLDRLAAQ